MATRRFYTDIVIKSDIILDNESVNTVPVFDGTKKIKSSSVTTTELESLSGIDSNVQDQIDDISADIAAEFTARVAGDENLQNQIDALPDPIYYAGTWNAATNTPALSNSNTGVQGKLYYVMAAGTVNFGAGPISFAVGDKVVNNGVLWDKWDNTDDVVSVFGRQGAISAQAGDYTASQVANVPAGNISATSVQAAINELDSEKFNSADFSSSFDSDFASKSTTDLDEGSNLYHTDERAQDAVGSILTDSNTIDFTYNDATPSIAAEVITQLSITSDSSGVKLVNDSAAPGNTKYYGTNGSGTKGYYDIPAVGSTGDIQETSFSFSNNVSSPANVTGFSFSNAVVRSFKAQVSIFLDATSDLFEQVELEGIQRGSDWSMTVQSDGDDSGLVFTITNAGQIQYTSPNSAGFSAGTIKFRALTTSV
jgi:hypothetical protein